MEAEQLARQFHDAYERLAPHYGYETRNDTRSFNPDSPNGRLMIGVCGEIIERLTLTDEEREAIEKAIGRELDAEWYGGPEPARVVTLRGLLERTK